jgi:hypothetical protein
VPEGHGEHTTAPGRLKKPRAHSRHRVTPNGDWPKYLPAGHVVVVDVQLPAEVAPGDVVLEFAGHWVHCTEAPRSL